MCNGKGIASNLLLVLASVGAAEMTWYDVRAYYWPGHRHGVWRLLFMACFFALGWWLRARKRRHHDVFALLGSLLSTGFVIAEIGNDTFDALPGPDVVDAYLLIGVFFAVIWWLRAVTNTDFRQMCGWLVVLGATSYRLVAWPYLSVQAFVATGL